MRPGILLGCAVACAVCAAAGFVIGNWYGRAAANRGDADSVVLTEDMAILATSGDAAGRVPAGTVLYRVPDPWADKTSAYKLFVETLASDDVPISRNPRPQGHRYETEKYALRSLRWVQERDRERQGTERSPAAK